MTRPPRLGADPTPPAFRARIARVRPGARRRQAGYLLEVPLILFVAAMVLSLVLPRLSPGPASVAVLVGAGVVLFCLYYMIVVPGWRPGAVPMGRAKRLALFGGACLLVVGSAALFIVHLIRR